MIHHLEEECIQRQATERNCQKLPVSLVMKYCPTSTTCTNPASIQNLLTLLSCESDSIRTVAKEFDDLKSFHSAKESLP